MAWQPGRGFRTRVQHGVRTGTVGIVSAEACWKCAGTGVYGWQGYVGGKPIVRTGVCFRCQGKGTITASDERRNDTHDALCDCWRYV